MVMEWKMLLVEMGADKPSNKDFKIEQVLVAAQWWEELENKEKEWDLKEVYD